jgi:hypothetical protein
MPALVATVVDTSALLKAVAASLGAGIGLTIAFSLAILGATRLSEAERSGGRFEAAAYGLLALVSLVACMALVAVGVAAMLSK